MTEIVKGGKLSDDIILFEDDELLVVNKPAKTVVNQAKTTKEETVQSWFVQRVGAKEALQEIAKNSQVWIDQVPLEFNDKYGTPAEIFLQKQGVVHRLDKDTSGVLVLAKNPGSLVSLLDQFKNRKVKKKYLCLVHGKIKVGSSVIRAPIARSTANRQKFRVDIEGRNASTHYRVAQLFSGLDFNQLDQEPEKIPTKIKKELESYQQGFSLVECLPKTGRTHQLRVHFSHLGHPIVSDHAYAGEKRSNLDKRWCPRQFLHAQAIELTHPKTGKQVVFKAELTEELQQVLRFLNSGKKIHLLTAF